MSTKSVAPVQQSPEHLEKMRAARQAKAPKAPTAQEKRIAELSDLRSKNKSTPTLDAEYKQLVSDKKKSDLARLATSRVSKALKAILQIRNLGRYNPSENQRKKVIGALQTAVESANTAWEGSKAIEGSGFQLEKE